MAIEIPPFRKYLPLSDVARDWGIWCTDAGTSKVQPGDAYPLLPKSHPRVFVKGFSEGRGRILKEYQLVYITKGRGSFRWILGDDNERVEPVEAGSVLLLFPGVWHSYAPDPDVGWDEYWVGFQGKVPESIREKGLLDVKHPVARVGLHDDLLADFRNIFDIIEEEPPAFQMILGGLVLKMLGRTVSLVQGSGIATGAEKAVRIAKIHFQEQLAGQLDLESILNRVDMSYSAFQRVFKIYTGLSPYQYYLQMKIHEACRLLLENNFSVKEIAYQLSFDNPYYFSRLFKKKTGLTPTEWQRGAHLNEAMPGMPVRESAD
jgi:AraC-like DNA-binding protein